MNRRRGLATVVLVTASSACLADFVAYEDFDEWSTAIESQFHTITFAELGGFEFLDEQYSRFGVTFPEANDFVDDSSAFENDLWGADGFDATITVDFAEDAFFVGIHYPGVMRIRPFRDGEMLADVFFPNGHAFAGLVSDEPFDSVVFFDFLGAVAIDDLHIPLIPAPPTAVVSMVGAMLASRRRAR